MSENKYPTNLNLKRCVGKNGNTYIGVTAELLVTKPSALQTTTSGKTFITFEAPVNKRGGYIGNMCGKAPYESDDTCWVRVTFWDTPAVEGKSKGNLLATRFSNFLAKHPKCVIIVTGAISVTESKDKNGREYTNTNISADDFFFMRDVGGNTQGYENPPKSAPNTNKPATTPSTSGPESNEEFYDLEFDDDSLPF